MVSRDGCGEDPRIDPRAKFVRLSIDAIEGSRPIGWVALRSDGLENRSASLGIAVGEKDFWNGGYGTDAMRVVCQFGFEMMNLNRIHLDVFPENAVAIRCYEKVGFAIEGRARDATFKHGNFHDLILMSVLAGELK
ncbi:MAG: GNAT family protein [Anaerolineaceae bacterium]